MNTETWNKLYPVGTDVFVTEDDGEQHHSRTRSQAWTLGNGQAVVKLEGYSGGYDLARVQPVEPIKRHMIHQPFGDLEKMPLQDVLDMMGSHGVAKIASTFSDQDDKPVFAVVLLSGPHIQHYLDAFDRIGEAREGGVDKPNEPLSSSSLDDAKRVIDLPAVDDALSLFAVFANRDKALMVVQAVIEAALPGGRLGAWTSKEQQADAWEAIIKLLGEVAPDWHSQTQKTGQQMALDAIRAMATDANRYRWLREKDDFPADEGDGRTLWEELCELDTADFDAWIDQRIAEDGPTGEGEPTDD